MEKDLQLVLTTIHNESLINRARNNFASMAIEHKYDRLLFIDGDIGWHWPDLLAIIRSNKRVVGAAYPRKHLPISLNYGLFPEQAASVRFAKDGREKHEMLRKLADQLTGELEVAHVPTGFLQIDVSVFHQLADKVASYVDLDGSSDTLKEIRDFFPIRVVNGEIQPVDQAFSSICRENGIPVYLNTNVILEHTGQYTFDVPR